MSVEAIKAVMDEDTAGLMVTNPNTIGLFEKNIKEIAKVVHSKGGFSIATARTLTPLWGL